MAQMTYAAVQARLATAMAKGNKASVAKWKKRARIVKGNELARRLRARGKFGEFRRARPGTIKAAAKVRAGEYRRGRSAFGATANKATPLQRSLRKLKGGRSYQRFGRGTVAVPGQNTSRPLARALKKQKTGGGKAFDRALARVKKQNRNARSKRRSRTAAT